MTKPRQADKVAEQRERGAMSDETKFVAQMRQKIYQLTDYDIEPNDSIYPLVACTDLLARGCVIAMRKEDAKAWQKIESEIRQTLSNYYGKPKPSVVQRIAKYGICLLSGLIAGIVFGFVLRGIV